MDRLVGAGIGVLVVLVALLLVLWGISDPITGGPGAAAPTPGSGRPDGGRPPDDLAADETWLGDVVLDAGTVATPESTLWDVRAVGEDVRTGPSGLLAGWASVDATVPYAAVAAQLGDNTTVSAADDEHARVVRTIRFAGREFRIVATGTVGVERGRLVVEPRSIDVGGPQLLADLVAAAVRTLVTIEHSVEGLPEGLVLQDVTVERDGFRATLEGNDVRLVPREPG